MESIVRGTSSIGLIASLRPFDAGIDWKGRSCQLSVDFSDRRHDGLPSAPGYRSATDEVVQRVQAADNMPGINLSLAGPAINIVESGRYIRDRVRRPR
jgi:hypothetical protein